MKKANNKRISYASRPDATHESEVDSLVAVYAFILEAHARKKAAVPSGPENGVKEDLHVHTKRSILR
jgi:hypothetical protein